MNEALVEPFIGKFISFLREDAGRQFHSFGTLVKIESNCIVIDFKGQTQIYSLKTILSVKEASKEINR